MDARDTGRPALDRRTPGRLIDVDPRPGGGARAAELRFARARLRVSSIADGIARVRLAPGGEFRPRRSWDVAAGDLDLDAPELAVREDEDDVELGAGPLAIRVGRAEGRVRFFDDRGEFGADVAAASWRHVSLADTRILARPDDRLPEGPASVEVSVAKAIIPGEGFFGFGQRTGDIDRRGRRLTNWNVDDPHGHGRHHDNLYQSHPVFMAVRPQRSWGLFLHSTFYSAVDAGADDADAVDIRTLGGELDYYVFAGPTPAAVVDQLTRLTGRPMLPPMWALGFHQSRWGYRDEHDIRAVAAEFADRDIPLDVIHFDIDYMRGYRDFTWNPDRFPDPAGLVGELEGRGVRAVTILDPGVKHEVGRGYATADSGLLSNVFVTNPDGSPFSGYCWPDAALFPDFARENVRAWWGAQHRDSHVDVGVSGIWNDMNEPSIFERPFSEALSEQRPMPLGIEHGADGERTTHAEVHNIYGLLMCRATCDGLLAARPDARPWVLSRSGYTGIQRYAATWMGDNHSWWEHLEMSVPQLASMGLSGVPHVGVDIGGFGENCQPELFARWMELAAFYPLMRDHSAHDVAPQEPWVFGAEIEEVARRMIRLRYRLLPYLYTLAHEASRTGAPMFRPMVFSYPEHAELHTVQDQVMIGSSILVCPIIKPRQEHRMVSFPPGNWYDLWDGSLASFGDAVSHRVVRAPLGRPAVFAQGIVPFGQVRNSTAEPVTELELAIYPAGDGRELTLVEDDGESFGYRRGDLAETRVAARETAGGVEVDIGRREGAFRPPARDVVVRLHAGAEPTSVELDGHPAGWRWEPESAAAAVAIPDDGEPHTATLHR